MADVEIRFTGDGSDAQVAALDIDRALEQIERIAEQVSRALGGVELKPGSVASIQAGSSVISRALDDIVGRAELARDALHDVKMSPSQAAEVVAQAATMSAALDAVSVSARHARDEVRDIGPSGPGTLLAAAVTGRVFTGDRRVFQAGQGGAPGTALVPYSVANLLTQNRVFATPGSFAEQRAIAAALSGGSDRRLFSDFGRGVRTFTPGSGVGALETDTGLNRSGGGSLLRDFDRFLSRFGSDGGGGGTRTGGGGFQRGSGPLAGVLPGGARATPAALGILAMAGIGTAPTLGAPILGALASIPAYATTGVAALGTLALAFDGVGKAIGGNVKEFNSLTPQAQQFALMIRGLDPLMTHLQETAQKAMFPGLTQGLQSFLNPGTVAGITKTVGQFGAAIGSMGAQWGAFLGSGGEQNALGQLATAGAAGLKDLSHVLMNLADAFTRVGVAALPLTNWFGDLAVRASRLIDSFIQQKQATGELGQFFVGLQAPISMVGHLIENLGRVIYELAAVLNGGGKIALQGLVDLLGGLADWLQKNQKELSTLVGELIGAFVGALRTILPLLGDVATALADVFKWVSTLPGPFRQIADAAIIAGIVGLAGGFSTLGAAIGAIAPAIRLAIASLVLLAKNPEVAALLAAMTALGYLVATGGQTDNFSSSSNPYGPPSTNVESLSPRRKKLAEQVIGYRNSGLSDAQIKTKMMKGHSGSSGYDLDIAQALTDASALQSAPSNPKTGSYTFAQLEALWIQAGGDPSVAPTMAAIALAESGGHPGDVGYDKNKQGKVTQVDRGLWQIGSVHGYSASSSLDPWQNAQQAVSLYNSQGLNAWATYTSGAYLSHMGGGGGKGSLPPGTVPVGTSKGALPIQMQIALQQASNSLTTAQGTPGLADDRKAVAAYKAQIQRAEAYLKHLMPSLSGQDLLDATTEMGSLISTWNSITKELDTAAKRGRATLGQRLSAQRSGHAVLSSIALALGPTSGLLSGTPGTEPSDLALQTPVADARKKLAPELAAWRTQIQQFEKELREKMISADAVTTIENRIDKIKTKVKSALQEMKTAAEQQKQAFLSLWGSYVQSFNDAFDQQTQDVLANPQKYPDILPLSAALADLEDQHTQQQLQQRLQDAQAQLANALAGTDNSSSVLTNARKKLAQDSLEHALDVAQSAIMGGKPTDMTDKIIRDMRQALTAAAPDPAAVKSAQQAVADAEYEIKVNGMQKQATAEQTAYEDSRRVLKQHLDAALALWGQYYAKSGETAGEALQSLNDLLVSLGFQPIMNPFDPGKYGPPPPSTKPQAPPKDGQMPLPGRFTPHAMGAIVTDLHYLMDKSGRIVGTIGEGGMKEAIVPVHSFGSNPYTTSTPTSGDRGDTHVHVSFANGMEWLEDFVDVQVMKNAPAISKKIGRVADHRRRGGRT